MKNLKVKKYYEDATLPTRANKDDAGLDLYSWGACEIHPQHTVTLPTGLVIDIPPGYVGLVRDRGSVSLKGLKVTAGVVDAGFRGQLSIVLVNVGTDSYYVDAGEKIAQILIVPVALPEVEEVTDFEDDTPRGEKAFGSSGA